jgi:hypothetical protein
MLEALVFEGGCDVICVALPPPGTGARSFTMLEALAFEGGCDVSCVALPPLRTGAGSFTMLEALVPECGRDAISPAPLVFGGRARRAIGNAPSYNSHSRISSTSTIGLRPLS